MSDLPRVVAERIRARRRTLGLSQAALAERADVSTELVSRIERQRCLPSITTLIAFANALDSSPNELLGFDPPRASRDMEELTAMLRSLPAARRRDIRRIAEAFTPYERSKPGPGGK